MIPIKPQSNIYLWGRFNWCTVLSGFYFFNAVCTYCAMLCTFRTFPNAFSQTTTFQEYSPKLQLPKCAISQAETSNVCPTIDT